MKVLVLIDAWFPFIGGAQIQIKNLKNILEKKYNCHYYILHSPSANIFIRFLWSLWVIPQTILAHQKNQFDLIHAHAYWPGIPGKILSKLLKIPVVFTVHGSNLMDLKVKSIRSFLEQFILTKIKYNEVITVSSNFLKYKNVNKNIVVIPNGVDITKFKIKNLKLKITNKNLKILYVGRLEKVKGVNYLIKAFKEVNDKLFNTQLIIVGEGSEVDRLKKLSISLHLQDKIIFQRHQNYNDLITEYQKADIFVLPSLSEGQPLTILEAWAARLPVIATIVGDNNKMVRDGFNGYLVKPKKVEALASTIIKVLKDKNRAIMGKRGYQLVKDYYSWGKCATKTYEIYKKLI